MLPLTSPTGLVITNPLVLYRALLATKRIDPDPAQHRLALHLQKLYYRLKDYKPEVDFSHRLEQLNRLVVKTPTSVDRKNDIQRTQDRRRGLFSAFRGQDEKAEVSALTRKLTNHESAVQLQSPQGLLLYGEVGTGKSLLVDLLADSLPSRRKRRWHFNTFMLEIFAKLEHHRRSRMTASPFPAAGEAVDEEHSLLWLARDMISTSPILFLDEFQLPDRTASKILSSLLTSFFHLGGVLIATSNRMPEELANATGVEFAAPPASRLGLLGNRWGLLGDSPRKGGKKESTTTVNRDFTAFLDVLKARCEVWDMEGARDWRRREAEEASVVQDEASDADAGFEGLEPMASGNWGLGYEQSLHVKSRNEELPVTKSSKAVNPKQYLMKPSRAPSQTELAQFENTWKVKELRSVHGSAETSSSDKEISWEPTIVRVFGRNLLVHRQHSGVTKWTFNELCNTNLGPADYITLASSFHTFILTDVPILTALQKNEARRFITLLDALYEARCKLLISAEAGPDDIFFPETRKLPSQGETGAVSEDGVYPETFSEIYQDQTSPFRPNISSYTSNASTPSYASDPLPSSLSSQVASARSILADEDSDFGPVYGAGRSSGTSQQSWNPDHDSSPQSGPNFAQTGTFTGEDERFAYKRARSRLWEMCGSRWWAREEEGWWRPVGKDVRRWEGVAAVTVPSSNPGESTRDVRMGESGDELFRHGASPFRTAEDPPPRFGFQHAWGMMRWGRKAGAWGKGPEGLDERKKGKE